MKIMKRSGVEVDFCKDNIINAIKGANKEVPVQEQATDQQIQNIWQRIQNRCIDSINILSVEDIQDLVEDELMKYQLCSLARAYITYRYRHALERQETATDKQILSLIELDNEEVKQENSNKNPQTNSTQRDYMAGIISKDISRKYLLSDDIVKAHEEGLIHFHDEDYFAQHMTNCCLVDLDDMLQNGTCISNTKIIKPHSFSTACTITTQIIAQVASSQYGGQTITLAHLAPFIDVSRQAIRKDVIEQYEEDYHMYTDDMVDRAVERRLKKEVRKGVQTIQYQIITLMTTNGQAPFVTIGAWINEVPEGQLRDDLVMLIEEVLKQRIQGVQNESGAWITPAFPKIIYVLDDNNTYPDSKYFWLTKLAAECTAKRMVPDYVSAKVMRKLKDGDVYFPMGCRSFLTPYKDPKTGKGKYYGRHNNGVVTLNLVDVACSSGRDKEKFWKILEDRLQLCKKALDARLNRIKGTVSDVAPIMWQYGAITRLKKGETIDQRLYGGLSTISLGYAGLCECVTYMTGKRHTDPEATPFALEVMNYLNNKCFEWREKENIHFSLYGTPLESTTYKLAKCLRKRFGIIEGVTDKNYITNSYHVHVTEEINAFDKLTFEAQFQSLSPGGAISYVEVPDLKNNLDVVLALQQHIYENIMYAELNTKSDYCQVCGFDGEIKIEEDENKKLIWKCPKCGNTDQNKLNVARRTCGLTYTSPR